MKPVKWIKIWIITTIILCILTSMANFIINPYDIYNIDLFNFKKVAIYNKLREMEPIKIKQTKPSSIVLGTSRPKHGIDVSHEYFKPVSYNLAISGGSIYENKQLFKLSIQQGNVKQVLLGLDYTYTNTGKNSFLDFEEILEIAYENNIDTDIILTLRI